MTQDYNLQSPTGVRETIFDYLHKIRTAGHVGRDRTTQAIGRIFYWPGMHESIKQDRQGYSPITCRGGPSDYQISPVVGGWLNQEMFIPPRKESNYKTCILYSWCVHTLQHTQLKLM